MSNVRADYNGFDQLAERLNSVGEGAGQIIQGVYTDFAAGEIKENALPLVHPSGRTFKGHRQSARSAGPDKVFTQEVKDLTLIVRTNKRFGYLYFPDDGSNTKRHAGNQQFMMRGMEQSTDAIIERCLAALTEDF